MVKKSASTRSKPMTSRQVYALLATALGLSWSEAREWILELERLARKELKRTGEFEIPGVLKLVLQRRQARAGRNPATGERIRTPAAASLKVRLSSNFSARVALPLLGASSAAPEREGAAPFPTAVKAAPAREREVVRVFYGTDRASSSRGRGHFGSTRAKTLSLGWCDVSVPRDHRLAVVERPSLLRLEFRENPDKHFVIVERHVHDDPATFWADLRKLRDSGANEAVIFIHGFNVGFDDAVYRTAQLSTDLQWKGMTLLYSWASNGRFIRYSADIENNDKTVKALKGFLLDVAANTGVTSVHVIAHSMGNRALANALHQVALAQAHDSVKIKNLVLTAPDIDADVFRDIAAEVAKTARRTTLYASSADKALMLSKKKALYPRAGDATEIVVVEGIDSIDATALKTDFVSHSYYGDNDSVLTDIHHLLTYGTPPPRFGLQGVPKNAPKYWRFQARR
jgi:esterase/lipase superfamily enzyme/nucleoid DNA-binding protein